MALTFRMVDCRIDGKAIGIIEAKKGGITLSTVHTQAVEYSTASTKHIQRSGPI